jgi:DNA-3-methyladenine glycosylase I
MSRDLKARGFKFVGTTICYALMQAAGMVNDHLVSCPRHAACVAAGPASTLAAAGAFPGEIEAKYAQE